MCGHVDWTCSKCPWSLTMTCPTTVSCTSTGVFYVCVYLCVRVCLGSVESDTSQADTQRFHVFVCACSCCYGASCLKPRVNACVSECSMTYNTHILTCSCRIGRSGRFGRKGVSINFVKDDDIRILRDIEQYYSTQVRVCFFLCVCQSIL